MYVNIGLSSAVDDGDDEMELNDDDLIACLFVGEDGNIDGCFDGDEGVLFNVNDVVVVGNFSSARLRLTPCSTGSNSNERFSDATANIVETIIEKQKIKIF